VIEGGLVCHDRGIFDEGDDLSLASAVITDQDVAVIRSLKQLCPGKPARANRLFIECGRV
jgi:hypothetical protein